MKAPRTRADRTTGRARRARLAEPWSEARDRRLRLAELFVSLQGEGRRSGWPTVFVRLTGCALRCRWCDTEWAFFEGRWTSLEQTRVEILQCGVPRVCVTGGEPLLQPSVVPLVRRLAVDEELDVVVETGGDQDISVLPARASCILDIKLPGSGMADRFDAANLARLRPHDEVKMVVADRADYEAARRWIQGPLTSFAGEIWLSPVQDAHIAEDVHDVNREHDVEGGLDAATLAGWMLSDRLRARLQFQLHKLLWPGRDRGI
ncbi:MAG: radical SAM protein [Acidobacteriota bacterium]|nr:MAG: radical SAM protein [Acidobacteriota bacterium]